MTSANDYEQLELQQQYSRVNVRWDASDDELDNDNSSARLFERSRIKALAGRARGSGLLGPLRLSSPPGATVPALLADEREAVQKKTFTKWVNSHLARVTCRISDLYMDLRDGRVLIKLLEVLSGELLVGLPASWRPWDPCPAMPCPAMPCPTPPQDLWFSTKVLDLDVDQGSTRVGWWWKQGCPQAGVGVSSMEGEGAEHCHAPA